MIAAPLLSRMLESRGVGVRPSAIGLMGFVVSVSLAVLLCVSLRRWMLILSMSECERWCASRYAPEGEKWGCDCKSAMTRLTIPEETSGVKLLQLMYAGVKPPPVVARYLKRHT